MGERAAHPPGEDNPSGGEQMQAEVDALREEVARLRLRSEGQGGVGPAPGGTGKGADGTPAVRPSPGRPPGPGRGVSRRGLLVVGGAAAVVVGGAAVTLLVRGDGEDPKGGADPKGVAPARSRPPASIPARPRLRRLGTLKGHTGGVGGLWFSPDGRTLVSSETDVGNLRLWDVPSGKPLGAPLTSPYVIFLSAAVTPDGRTLVTGGGDRAEFWSVPSRRPSAAPLTLSYEHAVFNVVAVSPDGKILATGGMGDSDTYGPGDGEVRLWDMASRRQVGEVLTGHEGELTGLVFSPDGRTLAVSSEVYEGTVRLWDVASRRPRGRPLTGHEGGVNGMVFSPDGRTLASAAGGPGAPGVVRFWDVATGAARGEPLRHDNWGVTALAYSGDGRTVVTVGAYETPRMRFWDAATHRERGEGLKPRWPNSAPAFAPDGVTLAAEEADASIGLWRIE